jgi:hypothetical protein
MKLITQSLLSVFTVSTLAFNAAACGMAQGKYDFTPLSTFQMNVSAGDYQYTVRLCGTSSQQCPNDPDEVITGMATQTNLPDHCYVLAQYDTTAVWTEGAETASLSFANGTPEDCPDGLPRHFKVNFVCDPEQTEKDISKTTFTVNQESQPCFYSYSVSTCLACDKGCVPPLPPPPKNLLSDLASMNPFEINVYSPSAKTTVPYGLIEHYSTISYDNDRFELYERTSKELVATGQVISRGDDNESAVVTSFEGACLSRRPPYPFEVALNSWCKCKAVFSMHEGNNKTNVVCYYKLAAETNPNAMLTAGAAGTVTGVYIAQRPAAARMIREEGVAKNLRGV